MLNNQKLPIGIQDFKKLREEDCLYVDKTEILLNLLNLGYPTFLSRPRRFGKSLTISTLFYLCSGKKELFKGTKIYSDHEFKSFPVILLDMSLLSCTTLENFENSLHSLLENISTEYGVSLSSNFLELRFEELIRKIAPLGKVVVLVDEYDNPILETMHDSQLVSNIRKRLKNFYGVLKSTDKYLKFTFITGISKFSKVGIFSGLNNLFDITLDEQYSTICGYTEQDLHGIFQGHVEQFLASRDLTKKEFWKEIHSWYDGYSWDGKKRLFNPQSILNLLLFRG